MYINGILIYQSLACTSLWNDDAAHRKDIKRTVPIVMLCYGGGPFTIHTLAASGEKPIIIVSGSLRAAQYIEDWCKMEGQKNEKRNDVSKDDEFCITDEEFCIKNEEFCIKNEEFGNKNEEICVTNDEICSRRQYRGSMCSRKRARDAASVWTLLVRIKRRSRLFRIAR